MIRKTAKKRREVKIKNLIRGSFERPRLTVFRSNKQIYAQVVNDEVGNTLASSSSLSIKKINSKPANKSETAYILGKEFGANLLSLKIAKIVFDRKSYRYHGRVKKLADGLRDAGVKFWLMNKMQENKNTKNNNFKDKRPQQDHGGIEDRVLKIRRVSTKRAGGSSFHFSALTASGDHAGNVGVAIAKSKENVNAIRKSKDKARRQMINVEITKDGSIPHEVYIKNGASKLFLKPAPLGAGIIAGGSVRQILELAGIKNVSAKIIGTNNQISNAYTLIDALKSLRKLNYKGASVKPVIEEETEWSQFYLT